MAEMKSIKVILYVALFGWVSSFSQNTTLRERIPAYLHQLCPGSGVCLNDIIDPDDDKPSCCGACSCSEDCETEGNCCFQSLNENTIDNTRSHTTQNNRECLHPIAKGKQAQVFYYKYRSYMMISTSQNDAFINDVTNSTVTCGEIKVAPWGSMFPVYSKSTGKIYKNLVCAHAHNVTDGELWDFYFSCDKYDADFMSKLQSGLMPEYCAVYFVYEEGISLRPEQCYIKAFHQATCHYNTFTIPAFLPITTEEIVAACESGLVSPYNVGHANIFCDICNKIIVLREETRDNCTGKIDIRDVEEKGNENIVFTIIFDASAFSKTFIEDSIQTERYENNRLACVKDGKTQTKDGCRTISCPVGQIFSPEDGCIYPGNMWSMNRMYIKISLCAERTINISNLFHSIQNLKSPWPKTWVVELVSYGASRIFIIQYIQLNRVFNPKRFFAKVYNYISKPWRLVFKNGTISLRAEITKFKSVIRWQELTSKVITEKYRALNMRPRSSIMITKFFFCQHVRLFPHEYSINESLGYLFNRITNETLLDAEYMVVENHLDVGPAVCLEDSGLYRVSTSKANEGIFGGTFVQCLAIIFTKIILQYFSSNGV